MDWRISPSFPDYEISERGDVRRISGWVYRSGKPRLLSQRFDRAGRPRVTIRHGVECRTIHVSVLVAEAFMGPAPIDPATGRPLFCLHDDGDPGNNDCLNLYYGNQKKNMEDRERHGRTPRGETNGNAKVTEADVKKIRDLRATTRKSAAEIGEIFGIGKSMVNYIVTGQYWRRVA